MIDGESTQQGECSQRGNGQPAEHEPHVTHLLPGERELLAECNRRRVYLALCGEVLPVPEGVFHLISAHEVVPQRWRLSPAYVALCGALVRGGSLVGTECPNECECDVSMAYCPDCLRAVIGQNHRAGVDAASSVVGVGG